MRLLPTPVEQAIELGVDALIERGERLAVTEGDVVIMLERAPLLLADEVERLTVQRTVVDLDERLLHHDVHVGERQRRGGAGAPQRRGPHFAHPPEQWAQGQRLAFAEFGERGIAAPHEQALRIRRGLAVANEDDHGNKSRPHSGQGMNAP